MAFVGGKLNLKGDKKSKKGKKKKSKHSHPSKEKAAAETSKAGHRMSREEDEDEDEEKYYDEGKPAEDASARADSDDDVDDDDDDMTEAERKALKYKLEAEKKDLEKAAKQSHRERVEVFSQKLAELTELNDIPRVSPVKSNVSYAVLVAGLMMVYASFQLLRRTTYSQRLRRFALHSSRIIAVPSNIIRFCRYSTEGEELSVSVILVHVL